VKKLVNLYLLASTMLLSVIGIATLCYAAFYSAPYLTYPNPVFPLVGDVRVFHPGEVVKLTVARCNADSVIHSYSITHAIRGPNGDYTILPVGATMIDPGCSTGISYINVLPTSDLKSGTYRFVGNSQIEGIFRQFAVYWESEPFEVIGDLK
jgi:hypothetical protein